MRHALSVDLEEYFQVSNFERVLSREDWDRMPSRLEDPTRRLLDLFDAHGARATFFTLGWVASRHGALLREIARRGHDVACHGHDHRLVYELGPEAYRKDLRRARAAIEDATGRSPSGFRAPSYSITARSRWALAVLAEEGFRYDSSIFPVRHPRYGWTEFATQPVQVLLEDGLGIDEFPPTTLDLAGLRLPVAGGAYLRFMPERLFRWAFARAAREGRPSLLYVHPWELDADQPRMPAGWTTRINHYFNLERTEARLEALLASHAFAPVADVLDELREASALPVFDLREQGSASGRMAVAAR